jgi:hypothetical protein
MSEYEETAEYYENKLENLIIFYKIGNYDITSKRAIITKMENVVEEYKIKFSNQPNCKKDLTNIVEKIILKEKTNKFMEILTIMKGLLEGRKRELLKEENIGNK